MRFTNFDFTTINTMLSQYFKSFHITAKCLLKLNTIFSNSKPKVKLKFPANCYLELAKITQTLFIRCEKTSNSGASYQTGRCRNFTFVYHVYRHTIQAPIFIVLVSTTSDPVKRRLVWRMINYNLCILFVFDW